MPTHTDCACLERGPRHPNVVAVRDLGIDESEGRFADVNLIRCTRCRRLWLRYHFEVEAFTASGRWEEAPIDDVTAGTMTAEKAGEFLRAAPWRIIGGSLYGHSGKRIDGTGTVLTRE